ncbi:ubiquinone/menaquinone biosynthesis methyltransferase [Desulfocurvus vexinensis]|uniref:ubiquinone/menaquinone biosynthesis methyltransferase n=1 Tax=Desulfocurvus vexinensis TaxID=399548 RepID=UPI001B7F8B03|nr:ubiquinone/menaquinone biosynthesis methyltransferase [Desulfocurvus vexinensis]
MSTAEHTAHAGRVRSMFGRIAGRYDFLNHFLSLGLDIIWRRQLVRAVRPLATRRFLDLAAGTMDVALELRRQHPGCTVLALDFALPMLQRGAAKLGGNRYAVQPVQADGRALPLPEGCVDAVTIAFGIRNILPRPAAYAEMLRVLTPGGRLCILEFGSASRPIWKGLYNLYLDRLLPLAGRVISGDATAYRYLADTIRAFPDARGLEEELRAAGFVNVAHEPLMGGVVNIHVAEKRLHAGDTFVVGAAGAKAPAEAAGAAPRPAPVAAPAAVAAFATPKTTPDPDPGQAALRAAANVEAALSALGTARQGAPAPGGAAKAPAKAKPEAKPKADAKAPEKAKAPAKPKAKDTAAKPKAAAKAPAKPTAKAKDTAPKAPAKPKPKAKPKTDAKAPAKPKAPKAAAKKKG